MRLQEYIRMVGPSGFAKAIEENERTVKSWLYGARLPKTSAARKIVERTPVTMDGIYGVPEPKRNGRRR
jgi:hypothetical protein